MIIEFNTDDFLRNFGLTTDDVDSNRLEMADAKLAEPSGEVSMAGGDVSLCWVNGVYSVKYHEIDAEETVPLAQARWMLAIEYMG